MPYRDEECVATNEHSRRRRPFRWLPPFVASSVVCAVLACSLDYSVGPFDDPSDAGDASTDARVDPIDGDAATDSEVTKDSGPQEAGVPRELVNQGTAQHTGQLIPIALDHPTKAGDLIVVITAQEDDDGIIVGLINDNAPGGSNTYVSANHRSVGSSCNDSLEIWYAANVRPGATSVNVAMGDSVEVEAWAMEFSGLSKTDPLDTGGVASNQPEATTLTAPAVTPSTPLALVISAVMACEDTIGLSAGSAFHALPKLNGELTAYFFTSKVGPYGAVWNANNGKWNASTVAFK